MKQRATSYINAKNAQNSIIVLAVPYFSIMLIVAFRELQKPGIQVIFVRVVIILVFLVIRIVVFATFFIRRITFSLLDWSRSFLFAGSTLSFLDIDTLCLGKLLVSVMLLVYVCITYHVQVGLFVTG